MLEGAAALVGFGRKLAEKGFVAATDGNLSVRQAGGGFLATPSGTPKGELEEAFLVSLDAEGRPLSGKVSTEWPMHLAIYRGRADVAAVVHAHPPYATALACAGLALEEPLLSEVILALGHVPLVPFELPSTEALASLVASALSNCQAVLLANHGAVTVGPDLRTAYYRMETLEQAARISLYTRQLGGGRPLPEPVVTSLRDLGKGYKLAPLPGRACEGCPLPRGEDGVWLRREELQSMLTDFARLVAKADFP